MLSSSLSDEPTRIVCFMMFIPLFRTKKLPMDHRKILSLIGVGGPKRFRVELVLEGVDHAHDAKLVFVQPGYTREGMGRRLTCALGDAMLEESTSPCWPAPATQKN